MAAASAPPIHRVLLIGQITLMAVFLFLYFRGIAPLQGSDTGKLVAYALSAISIVQIVVAFFVLIPRVPTRLPAQSVEQYWSSPSSTQPVFLVWFILEGATVLSAVGFFLTGDPLPAIVACVATVVFAWNGPGAFAER
jgi:hypothetical protein